MKKTTRNRRVNQLFKIFYILNVAFLNCLGDPRIKHFKGIDCFLQFDQNQILPRSKSVKSVIIVYDLIPYILEKDYLNSYKTLRNRGHSFIMSLVSGLRRYQYVKRVRLNVKRAHRVIAISENTKKDFLRYTGVKKNKISVCLLGVGSKQMPTTPIDTKFKIYKNTVWGVIESNTDLLNNNFLLFIGGADPRRKIIDLVAAFNNLRAIGIDLKLVLAGDTMVGPTASEYIYIREYFKNTSYLDDIYFLGFVSEEQKAWLYKNTVAFIYPSIYEGFGLPILEAMQSQAPVITYKNSSIEEISSDAVIYANDYIGIKNAVVSLINDDQLRQKYIKRGIKNSSKYTWTNTAENIYKFV
jgi:glycosyltransferase involved in cell wall biosynthesis